MKSYILILFILIAGQIGGENKDIAYKHYKNNRYAKSIHCLLSIKDSQKNKAFIYNNIGISLLKMGLFSEAERFLKKALHFAREYKECIYYNLYVLNFMKNNLIAAKYYLKKVHRKKVLCKK